MESTYWQTEGKGHHLDVNAIKLTCFHLLNLLDASRAVVKAFDAREAEEPTGRAALEDPAISLHQELADAQTRIHLLQLAMLMRTYDDWMLYSEVAEAYEAHAAKTDGGGMLGFTNEGNLTLRTACNKIIHALELRPVLDRFDRTVGPEPDWQDERLLYLTGEVEIAGPGPRGKSLWEGVLNVREFVEAVLERVSFQSASGSSQA